MRFWTYFIAALGLAAALPSLAADQPATIPAGQPVKAGQPVWAYPLMAVAPGATAPPTAPPDTDPTLLHVPNSKLGFTRSQLRDSYNVPDWFPESHLAPPNVVTKGGGPGVLGCGSCHLPNGVGRPENANLTGLPEAYVIQQLADFKSGARKSADERMGPPRFMANIAKLATEEQVREAAAYFSKVQLKKPWIRVVEATTVPKAKVTGAMYVTTEGQEPLGTRILEVAEDKSRTDLRDTESGFVAYVPPGSVERGKMIATQGELTGKKGKVTPCVACHGADLRGLGPVPPISGRSPSYLVRQLFDLQQGTRAGLWSPLMKNVVEKLDSNDLIAVAAYASSQHP